MNPVFGLASGWDVYVQQQACDRVRCLWGTFLGAVEFFRTAFIVILKGAKFRRILPLLIVRKQSLFEQPSFPFSVLISCQLPTSEPVSGTLALWKVFGFPNSVLVFRKSRSFLSVLVAYANYPVHGSYDH